MKLNLLVENKTYKEHLHAEHALSLLIETDEKTILFDSGENDALVKNAKLMGLDLSKVDLAVLSHGHFDHSGGFPFFNKINPNAKIYLHKNSRKETYDIDKEGKATGDNLGIRWTEEEWSRLEPNLVYTDGTVNITDNIIISGSLPREMRETDGERFLEKTGDEYKFDEMEHEQFLIIKDGEYLYIFSGCSHNGVVPIIEYTKKVFPDKKIKLLFGGLHLYSSSYNRIVFEVNRITSLDVELFMPVHCTGLTAILQMKELLSDRCIVLNAGDEYSL